MTFENLFLFIFFVVFYNNFIVNCKEDLISVLRQTPHESQSGFFVCPLRFNLNLTKINYLLYSQLNYLLNC